MSFLPLNAFSVFLAIAAVGFLFLMISLFFGEIFEHFDGALDHDLDHGGPGFFSTRIISVFITAFGGFGAIATDQGLGPLAASVIGAVSGFLLAAPVYFLARFLYGQQATSESRSRISSAESGASSWPYPPVASVRCGARLARAHRQDCPGATGGGDCREHAGRRRGSRRRNRGCQTSLRRGEARLMSFFPVRS